MKIRFTSNNVLFPKPRIIEVDDFEMRGNVLLVKIGQYTSAIAYDNKVNAWKFSDTFSDTYYNNFEVTSNPSGFDKHTEPLTGRCYSFSPAAPGSPFCSTCKTNGPH